MDSGELPRWTQHTFFRLLTGAVVNSGAEKKLSKSRKRKIGSIVDPTTTGPIRLPRPVKMCKTQDGRKAVDLVDPDDD
jgi:hypothetical protein